MFIVLVDLKKNTCSASGMHGIMLKPGVAIQMGRRGVRRSLQQWGKMEITALYERDLNSFYVRTSAHVLSVSLLISLEF